MSQEDHLRKELIAAVKEMARRCFLENWEQISNERGAIGAVRRMQQEYLGLIERKRAAEKTHD